MQKYPKRLAAALIAVILLFSGVLAEGFSGNADAIEEAALSVLMLEVYDAKGKEIATGSGFVMFDNMTLVTNYHVIEGGASITAVSDEGYEYSLNRVLVSSKYRDLAILRFSVPTVMKPLPYSTESLKRSEGVVAIGSPLGFKNTVSKGNISGFYNEDNVDYIMFTASISHGSSGGALFNDKGEVVGVTSAYYTDGQNMNLAIAIHEATDLYASWDGTTVWEIKDYAKADAGTAVDSDWLDTATVETTLDIRSGDGWVKEVSGISGILADMADLEAGQYYSPYMTITNNSAVPVSILVSAELDSEPLYWESYTLEANDYANYYVKESSAPGVGSHTIIWSVNGEEAARFSWTVKDSGVSDELVTEMSLDVRTEQTWVREVGSADGIEAELSELAVGEYYTPYLVVTNNTAEDIVIKVTAAIGDDSWSWDEYTLTSGDYVNCFLSASTAPGEGSHTIIWKVNGKEAGTFSWTLIPEAGWVSTAGIETSLDIRTASDYIREVTSRSGASVLYSKLTQGQYYSPYLGVTNNTSHAEEAEITAVLNGEVISWEKRTVNAGETVYSGLSQSSDPGKGSHTIIWSVNGIEVATFKWTVK
ncbi:MAG: serine protease [Clostridia bacterium]|nr:serine protease [Clostridia bacterium]